MIPELLSVVTISSIVWAIGSLLIQWYIAWGGGRRELSQQSGKPAQGVLYNFTIAMLPSHKETVKLHFAKFSAGIIMHTGAFIAILTTLSVIFFGEKIYSFTLISTPILIAGTLAALFLTGRRFTSKLLKSLSNPDDYFAVIVTTIYILLALLLNWRIIGFKLYLIYSTLFFFYLPLGKLRHALFFFLARGDYGRRLGYRGVYPASPNRE